MGRVKELKGVELGAKISHPMAVGKLRILLKQAANGEVLSRMCMFKARDATRVVYCINHAINHVFIEICSQRCSCHQPFFEPCL